MKQNLLISVLLMLASCGQHKQPTVISLSYKQSDIQRQFDTLYNKQQTDTGVYTGFMEQALAHCHGNEDTVTQDVLSSMYLNQQTGNYDCVTTTTFQFPDGSITAMGIFNLVPGSGIAPDHDFPITGGSAAYRNIYGTYTRKYKDSVYYVVLQYYKRD